ncbi:hypothetical protein MMC28_006426 [Mycoblastus sanguinarius]|nr:hypothetical protein [Mycoblastus sanguinarius]
MTPAFGFSIGDIISAINLIRKISKALKETGGASSAYQDAIIELEGLKHALQQLEAFEPTEDNISHVNAIRGMALACKLPLQDFMTKLEKYESSLGAWAYRNPRSTIGRKARWAVSFGQEVEKFRALVAAKQISINLLLTMHCSQTFSSINSRSKREHGDLISKIVENQAALLQVQGIVENTEGRMGGIKATSEARLDAMLSKSDATHASVMSLRTLGERILGFVRTFPREIRDLLQKILQADWRTYQAVLQIQEHLARSPTSLQESNIQFTNALGEFRRLPYEYFCQWEPFEGFLRAQFKNKPGETKILDESYHIIDLKNHKSIVKKEHWSRSISQGAILAMSMIMSHMQRIPGHCPRPDCTGVSMTKCPDSDLLACETCYLKFFPDTNSLEHLFSRVNVSEEEITRQQVEEDLQLYGRRLQPSDTSDVDDAKRLANLPPKRKASESEAAGIPSSKVRKKGEDQSYDCQAVTTIDWNNGASPLDAWLNQSAVPSTGAIPGHHASNCSAEDQIAQELEEIKVFRNVHIGTERRSLGPKVDPKDEPLASMELGAQIYYRNILDRYPLLPVYLARRLAQANHERAERLRLKSQRAQPPPISGDSDQIVKTASDVNPPWHPLSLPGSSTALRSPWSTMGNFQVVKNQFSQKKHKCKICDKRFARPSSLRTHMYRHTGEEPYSCEAEGCGRRFFVLSNLRRHRKVHKYDRGSDHSFPSSPKVRDFQPLTNNAPSSDFWTSKSTSRRPSSTRSCSSSMNSSLRGETAFDPQEQEPTFLIDHSKSSSVDFDGSSPGLPPPPAEIGNKLSFNCDICGDVICVGRRYDWQ